MRSPLLLFLISALCCVHISHAQSFSEVAEASGINFFVEGFQSMGGGMAWFDFDGDLDDDLYLCGGSDEDKLYRNNGDGSFTDISPEVDLFETSIRNTMGVVTGDIDNDGYREILVSTWNAGMTLYLQRNLLYYNNGDGTFTEIGESAGLEELKFAMPPSFVDLDQDGFLDIYMGNYLEDNQLLLDENGNVIGFDHICWEDDIYLNNGDLTFTKVDDFFQDANTGCTLAIHPTDFDKNGHVDVMVVNDFGQWTQPNRLYSYQPLFDQFQDQAPSNGADIGLYGMGLAAADFDRDQDMDYYCTNIGANAFLKNDDGMFSDVAESYGVANAFYGDGNTAGWGTFFFDYNNNGWKDLYVANGHIPAVSWLANDNAQSNFLFRNNLGESFVDVTGLELPFNDEKSRGAAFSDYNQDGRVDFGVHTILNSGDWNPVNFRLFENLNSVGSYAQFKLRGSVCNRDAYGARVEVYVGETVLMDEVQSSSSHMSQNSSVLHFGLTGMAAVDSVQIHWPSSNTQTILEFEMNALNHILQDTTSVAPPDTTEEEYINHIISLPAGEGLIHADLHKRYDGLGNLTVYPNPAEDFIGLDFEATSGGDMTLDLLDSSGRKVHALWSGKLEEGNHQMQFYRPFHLPAGSYLMRIHLNGECVVLKLQLSNP